MLALAWLISPFLAREPVARPVLSQSAPDTEAVTVIQVFSVRADLHGPTEAGQQEDRLAILSKAGESAQGFFAEGRRLAGVR